jgi:hypothetical protein
MKQGASANGIIYAGTKSYDTNKTFWQDIQDIMIISLELVRH